MTNVHVNIKDNKTGEFIRVKNILIQGPIKKLHNDILKPSSEVSFVGARLELGYIINLDTLLIKYISPQV